MQPRYTAVIPKGQCNDDAELLLAAKVQLAMRLKGLPKDHIDQLKIVSTRAFTFGAKEVICVELA